MRVFETPFNFKPPWKHTSYLKFDFSTAASNKGINSLEKRQDYCSIFAASPTVE